MFSGIRLYASIGAAIVIVGLLAWGLRLDHLRGGWKDRVEALTEQAGIVLLATREAADNPELEWEQASGQIYALGASNARLKVALSEQNERVDDMAREAVRLKAQAEELRRIAEKARAQRRAALDRLSDMEATPGTRSDCLVLLQEAEEALDLIREAGA